MVSESLTRQLEQLEQPDYSPDWPVEKAFDFCTRLATGHYENFPVGSRWIPKDRRKYVHAIYAFARIADDYADEARHQGHRLEKLHQWRQQLRQCYAGGPVRHPVFQALSVTAGKFHIPESLLAALLSAFEQDVTKSRYADFNEVLDYCRRSANPVGRLVLLLFEYRDETLMKLSDSICTGLQLANFWQDVAIDLKKDRIYLPQDEMAQFGVTEEMLHQGQTTQEIKKLMHFQVERTRQIFMEGKTLPDKVRRKPGFELRLIWLGGNTILDKLEKNDYDFFSRRPTIGLTDKMTLLIRALLWKKGQEPDK